MNRRSDKSRLFIRAGFGLVVLIFAGLCLIPSKAQAGYGQNAQQQDYPSTQPKTASSQQTWNQNYAPAKPLPKAESKGGLQDYVQAQPQPKTELSPERKAYADKVRASYNFSLVKDNISLPGTQRWRETTLFSRAHSPMRSIVPTAIRRPITNGVRHFTPILSAPLFTGQA